MAEDRVVADILANACKALNAGCFAAGTKLLTRAGWRAVETIEPGDEVLSRSEFDPAGDTGWKVVEARFERTGRILHLHAGGEVVRTTPEHPFYVDGAGWTPAGMLKAGDRIASLSGEWVTVEEAYDTGEYEPVYNVRVADYHTYFVGDEGWGFSLWVHNSYAELKLLLTELIVMNGRGSLPANHQIREAMLLAKKGSRDSGLGYREFQGILRPAHITLDQTPFAWAAAQYDLKAGETTEGYAQSLIERMLGDEEIHHLMAWENYTSTNAGGPFTPKFLALAARRGWTNPTGGSILDIDANKVSLRGHEGPHPRYNAAVWKIMRDETQSAINQDDFNAKFDAALAFVRSETLRFGSELNLLATGK